MTTLYWLKNWDNLIGKQEEMDKINTMERFAAIVDDSVGLYS